ncbi:MAG: hypothetical protein ACOYM9_26355, partial [Bradymonadia bacterium]
MSVLPAARVVRGGDAPAHLQPAPRRVPARLVWRLLFGSPIGIFGWCFVAFGMGFILASVPRVEFVTPDHDRETTATIMLVTPTGASENDQPIYRVDYVFTDATGAVMSGTSYTKDPTVHGTQRVEYVPGPGIKAASRATNCSGVNRSAMVPERRPSSSRVSRSSDNGGLSRYRQSLSRPALSRAPMATPACRLKPSTPQNPTLGDRARRGSTTRPFGKLTDSAINPATFHGGSFAQRSFAVHRP